MEVIARNNQDLLEDLVELKRRQYGLAGIVQDCDLLHGPWRILTCWQRVTYVPKVTTWGDTVGIGLYCLCGLGSVPFFAIVFTIPKTTRQNQKSTTRPRSMWGATCRAAGGK